LTLYYIIGIASNLEREGTVMPKGKGQVALQTVVNPDIARKLDALAEKIGIKRAAVVALAISELADAHRIVLREVVDPNQTSMFEEGGATA